MKLKTALAMVLTGLLTIACSEQDKVPERKITTKDLVSKLRGYLVPKGIVYMPDYKIAWIQQVATGYSKNASLLTPGKLKVVASRSQCTFTKPLKGELVQHFYGASSGQPTKVYNYSNARVRKYAKKYIKSYKARGPVIARNGIYQPSSMRLTDIFVTETAKPVYLVLSSGFNIIWNIQPAAKAKIARIVIIGGRQTGYVNAPEGVPVEILTGKNMTRCGVQPAREPQDHWGFIRNAKEMGGMEDVVKKNYRYFNRYATWLRKAIGGAAVTKMFDVNKASHALIGPLPASLDQRIAYKSIKGKPVSVTATGYLLVTTKKDFKKRFKEKVIKLATKMVGGDLTVLRPKED